MGETIRIIAAEVDFISLLLQDNRYSVSQRTPRVASIYGILHVWCITREIHVTHRCVILFGRETEILDRISRRRFIDSGVVIDIRCGMCLQFLVPTLEDGAFAELRGRALVYRHIFAVGGVAPKLRAVRVQEDDDWGSDDVKTIRHL